MSSGREPSGSPASWLATTFVVLGGIACCVFITLAFSDNPQRTFWIFAGGMFTFCALLWLLRERRPVGQHGWWRRGRRNKVQYRAIFRMPAMPATPPPQPPTATSVREIAENSNLWVPSQAPRRRKTPPHDASENSH